MVFAPLVIDKFEPEMLSEYQVYLLVSPVTIYLWTGSEVTDEIRNSSLSIVKGFYQEH
jgi:hypothetical protein